MPITIRNVKQTYDSKRHTEDVTITFSNDDIYRLILNTRTKRNGRRALLMKKLEGSWSTIELSAIKHKTLESFILGCKDDERIYQKLSKMIANQRLQTNVQKPQQCERCSKRWTIRDELTKTALCIEHYTEMTKVNNRHRHWEHVAKQYHQLTGEVLTPDIYHQILNQIFETKESSILERKEKSTVHQMQFNGRLLVVEVITRSQGTIVELTS